MTLVKLYHDINFSVLVVLFQVHRTTVSYVIKSTISILGHIMQEPIYFPDKESVLDNLPIHFKNFRNTRVVLDSSQVRLERPGDLSSRILTRRHYKRSYTVRLDVHKVDI